MVSEDELHELAGTVVTRDSARELDGESPPRSLQLVVIGNGTSATHPLPDTGQLTIGRSKRSDITVDDESISRRHAILTISDRVTIEDLGSANGTRVRGALIASGRTVAIEVGELVSLGNASAILQQRSRSIRPRRMWTHDYFEARLEEACAQGQRSEAPFALVHIRLDRSARKSFVEETLAELVRESDILGKYGPHAYEVILFDTPAPRAEEAVRRIEGTLVERGLQCELAIACCPRDGKSPYQLAAKVLTQSIKVRAPTIENGIVVSDRHMQSLHRMVEQIAGSQIGVLLLGETGVGKEVFARAVHRASPRAAGPFVELNCAALTETLLESELFGHEKGAFTNATSAKPGIIEMAHGGTLLLDEIGDMPLSTQVKLLRVIEDSQLRRVGGLKPKAVDVRFVAATNSDLDAQMANGAFRRDLFFRLNGVTIVIPPLRERLADLEPLARSFIVRAWPRHPEPAPMLSTEALTLMRGYSWPGNVRELKNVIERAVLLCGSGPIRSEHLPEEKMRTMLMTTGRAAASAPRPANRAVGTRSPEPDSRERDTPFPDPPTLAGTEVPAALAPAPMSIPARGSEAEQKWIMDALERAGGNQTSAARALGISRRTLVNRLNEYEQVHRPRKHKETKRP